MKQIAISEEDRSKLVEQLESLAGRRPLFYLKFCSCENLQMMYVQATYMQIHQNILENKKSKVV